MPPVNLKKKDCQNLLLSRMSCVGQLVSEFKIHGKGFKPINDSKTNFKLKMKKFNDESELIDYLNLSKLLFMTNLFVK